MKKFTLTLTDTTITRTNNDNPDDVVTLDLPVYNEVTWYPTTSELKNLLPVFTLYANAELWSIYQEIVNTPDKDTRWHKLVKVCQYPAWRAFTRERNGIHLPAYGLGIWLDKPSSTQSVELCIDGKIQHTKEGFSAIESDYISLDVDFITEQLAIIESQDDDSIGNPDDVLNQLDTVSIDSLM